MFWSRGFHAKFLELLPLFRRFFFSIHLWTFISSFRLILVNNKNMVVTLFKLIFPSIHNTNCATCKFFGRIWTIMLLPLKIYTSWKLFRPTKRTTCRCLGPLSKMKLKSTQCISIIYCTKLKHPFLLAFKILFRTYTLPFRLLHQLFTNEIPTKKKSTGEICIHRHFALENFIFAPHCKKAHRQDQKGFRNRYDSPRIAIRDRIGLDATFHTVIIF